MPPTVPGVWIPFSVTPAADGQEGSCWAPRDLCPQQGHLCPFYTALRETGPRNVSRPALARPQGALVPFLNSETLGGVACFQTEGGGVHFQSLDIL